MQQIGVHTQRIDELLERLRETTTRFTSRIEGAADRAAPPDGGWSAAQIAAHVALVNESLASVIDGSAPGAAEPPDQFQERPWEAIARGVPVRNQAPARFVPPDEVTTADAMDQFRRSTAHLIAAVAGLSPERARHCFTSGVVGTISLYQAGEFALAHMIRHTQQAKRLLEA
jgi:hypothetical protein